MTLTERRKRIRRVRDLLARANDLTLPHMRDLDKSDALIGQAWFALDLLVDDLAEGRGDAAAAGRIAAHRGAAAAALSRQRSH